MFRRRGLFDAVPVGERMRREHEAWLNAVLYERRPLPRIPTRAVAEGGFGRLLSTLAGRRWVRAWWERVLRRADLS